MSPVSGERICGVYKLQTGKVVQITADLLQISNIYQTVIRVSIFLLVEIIEQFFACKLPLMKQRSVEYLGDIV